MTGLIAVPIAPAAPVELAADGWFPPIGLARIRACLPIGGGGGSITNEQLQFAIEGGMLTALAALSEWRSAHAAAGVASLADLPSPVLAGRKASLVLWERAVAYYACADLVAVNVDITATDAGLNREEEKASKADEFRRLGHAAIADLRSIGAARPIPRNMVRLL
ncbi:hypothetical protein EOE18_13860 [Novosphingobium umbonatum]|uniref:Head completion/stabilization protein n=1 Tax=Novosphingobium umbonatum TaxID=1908524 RepID=A0A3S2X2D7_9SPHN|nr:head completion/stabilization protein [Novosphingobium umbonatum]RVU03936.1 hypothetical protein EOE18_13860 [Novosphingobium umbonatum]